MGYYRVISMQLGTIRPPSISPQFASFEDAHKHLVSLVNAYWNEDTKKIGSERADQRWHELYANLHNIPSNSSSFSEVFTTEDLYMRFWILSTP